MSVHGRKYETLPLTRNTWRSGITLNMKLHLYKVYILPILLYGCETWSTMQSLYDRLDALIAGAIAGSSLSYLQRVTNEKVMRRTATILPATQAIHDAKLHYFCHVARLVSAEDHCRAISAALKIHLNQEWKCSPASIQSHLVEDCEERPCSTEPWPSQSTRHGRVLRTASPVATS